MLSKLTNLPSVIIVAVPMKGLQSCFVIVTDTGSDVTVKTCFAEVGDGPACITDVADADYSTSGSNNVVAIE